VKIQKETKLYLWNKARV